MTSLSSIDYELPKLKEDLIALQDILAKTSQGELSWLVTAYTQVQYDDPQMSSEIRKKVQNLSCGLCVLYLVTLLEQYFPNTYPDSKRNKNLWAELHSCGLLSTSDLSQLRAYRHVRHSFAHNPNGTHADNSKKIFNDVMKGPCPLPGIKSDGIKITVESAASLRMLDVVRSILQNVLANLAKALENE